MLVKALPLSFFLIVFFLQIEFLHAFLKPQLQVQPRQILHNKIKVTGYSLKTLHSSLDDEDEFTPAGEMRVSEIKAELEMRGIGFADVFEKEELVRRLENARLEGKANPDILNDFNKRMMEKNLNQEGDFYDESFDEAVQEITANDGTLPGGLTPEAVKKLTSNPEIMKMLQNPRLQDAMKVIMTEGPSGMSKYSSDPEMVEMIGKLSAVMQEITSEE